MGDERLVSLRDALERERTVMHRRLIRLDRLHVAVNEALRAPSTAERRAAVAVWQAQANDARGKGARAAGEASVAARARRTS